MNSKRSLHQRSGFPKPEKYGAVSQFLHWLTALAVLLMLGLGWGREFAPGPWKPFLIETHKSLGLALLALILFRALWRLMSKPPKLPEGTPFHIELAAQIVHAALYTTLVAMPLSGWAMISAMGRDAWFLGFLKLPGLLDKTPSLVPFLKETHEVIAWALVAFVALHIGGALYHQLILKDGLLRRMLP